MNLRICAVGLVAALTLAGCEEPAPIEDAPKIAVGEGMSQDAAAEIAGAIFAANGCSMSINSYLDRLDEAGYAAADHDASTPEGHRAMVNRFILETTPMLLAEDGRFTRRGSTLTSKIGGCADAATLAS